MDMSHHELFDSLDVSDASAGVLGICYSILNWSGIAKGSGASPSALGHTLSKVMQDGHATTFLWVKATDVFIKTGIARSGWTFCEESWARITSNATTYVYYIEVDQEFIDSYMKTAKRLLRRKVFYGVGTPNLLDGSEYQNCVSSTHQLLAELGLGSVLMTKGFWMPSIANWVHWFSTFAPRTVAGFTWKYIFFPSVNTLIPGSAHKYHSIHTIEAICFEPPVLRSANRH